MIHHGSLKSWLLLFALHGVLGACGSESPISQIQSSRITPRHRVFLLGGQSNMAGESPVTPYIRKLKVPQVEIFCVYHDKFLADQDVYAPGQGSPSWQNLRPCGAYNDRFGPEMTFGQAMHQKYPEDKIYLIKYAHGGTSLACEWQPYLPSAAYRRYGDKVCFDYLNSLGKPASSMRTYERFLTAVNWGLASLRAQNIDFELEGMLWFQGEADADGRQSLAFLPHSYGENLPHFVKNVRSAVSQPNLPFTLAQIKCGYDKADWDATFSPLQHVRSIQKDFELADPWTRSFDTMDLPMLSDGCHYNGPAMEEIGRRFAKTVNSQRQNTP